MADKPNNRGVKPGHVAVRVGKQGMVEEGAYRAPGDVFAIPKKRAEALGSLVTEVEAKDLPEPETK